MVTGVNNPQNPRNAAPDSGETHITGDPSLVAPTGTDSAVDPQAAAPASTIFTIRGHQFDLHNMSEQTALNELYPLLESTDQQRAQTLARFIREFRAPLATDLPAELQEPGHLTAFIAELQRGSGHIGADAPGWMQNLYSNAASAAGAAPGADQVRAIVHAVQAIGSAAATGGHMLGEARDWVMLTPRAIEYAMTRGTEWWSQTHTPPTENQALAMASAYQGALVASRTEPSFVQKGWSYVQAGWEALSNSSVGIYVSAFIAACSSWLHGNGFNWQQAVQDAQATVGPGRSRDEILQQDMEQPTQAQAQLRAAGTVAGRSTEPVADILGDGGYFRDYHDNIQHVDRGGSNTAPVNHADGTHVTIDEVNDGRTNELTGGIGRHGVIAAGGGALIAGYPAYRMAQGVARERIHGPERAAARSLRTDERLAARETAAREAGDTAKADRIHAQRERANAEWERNTRLAEARRETAGRFTEHALNPVNRAGEPAPVGRTGRIFQWFGARTLTPVAEGLEQDVHTVGSIMRWFPRTTPAAAEAAAHPIVAPVATPVAESLWSRVTGWFRSAPEAAASAETSTASRVATAVAESAPAAESGIMSGVRAGLSGMTRARGGWVTGALALVGAGGLWLIGPGQIQAATPETDTPGPQGTSARQATGAGATTVALVGGAHLFNQSAAAAAAAAPVAGGTESSVASTLLRSAPGAARGMFGRLFGPVVGTALAVPAIVNAVHNNDGHEVTRQAGGLAGGLAGGAAVGAALGAPFFGLGAIPGGIIGGIVGGALGWWGGSSVADAVAGDAVQHQFFDGAAGPADPGLQVANQNAAQAQARRLAFANSNVTYGGNAALDDFSAPARPRPGQQSATL